MSANPWGDTSQTDTASDPWGGGSEDGLDYLADRSNEVEQSFDIIRPFDVDGGIIPLDNMVDSAIDAAVPVLRPFFQVVAKPIDWVLNLFETALVSTPAILVILILSGLAWWLSTRKIGIGTLIGLVIVGLIGAWDQAMTTIALVITSLFFCVIIGLPIGIWLSRSDRAVSVVRPILDAMQTTPAFVYLIPIVMLFSPGKVAGVVVTIIFAVPPVIRLTNLGIRQVPEDLIEAARAFGTSPRQLLLKVQLPLALPTIMAGVNQTLMLGLSMVVIASMIAVPGLGLMVLQGIGRNDIGIATVGGLGIVVLAIVLDRITQHIGSNGR
ncbi:glycine betaine/L-proline ABC transporter permease ProW [Salinibius halmophilus]|uniref:glycine betaine/L-proline ABC transporter permease ProW n=1 Tax=Salinibius halmophilus TaxID=1853216 RepID=UPI000E665F20|nr:glycine betaine/L-proline ABC transporter permease ProW [Salinibius halmophilus]